LPCLVNLALLNYARSTSEQSNAVWHHVPAGVNWKIMKPTSKSFSFATGFNDYYSLKKCWVISTQIWVKYGQTQLKKNYS